MLEPLPVSPAAACIIGVIIITSIVNLIVMFRTVGKITRACRASTATVMRVDAVIWAVASDRTLIAEARRTHLVRTDAPPLERKKRD